MKHLFTHLFILVSAFALNAQTLSGPESIEYDAANNRYLISNTSSGQILARAANGTLSVFKSGISPSPYGLEILGNRVYACCGGFIKGFNLETGAQEFNLNLGGTFLNGITTDGFGNLFATDFTAKKIFRIKINTNSFTTMASNLGQSPNGICFDQANNRLVFVNWGSNAPIKSLSLSDSSVTTLASTSLGNCDGIVWNGLDTWYVTAWSGQKVMRFDANFLNAPTLVQSGLNSPADIDYNLEGDTLAIPNSGNNTLTFIGFPAIQNVDCALLPLSVMANDVTFESSLMSFGNAVIKVPLLNNSGLGFAYPLARLSVIGNLPNGMSWGNNQDGFNVFASAWNPDSIATAEFYFNTTEPIPTNTLLTFELEVTNLSPSSADTCYFTQQFNVNLNPENALWAASPSFPEVSIYPNPTNEKVYINVPQDKGDWKIELIGLDGRIVLTPSIMADQSVHLNELKSGIYILRATCAHKSWICRLIKQ
jgi:hypothetical protein